MIQRRNKAGSPEERRVSAQRYKSFRFHDREHQNRLTTMADLSSKGPYLAHTSLEVYNHSLGYNLLGLVNQMLRHKKNVRVLDVGCGTGLALREIKQGATDPNRVTIDGVTLSRLPSHKHLNKVYVRDYELKPIHAKYDLIITNHTAIHFDDYPRVIERMFSQLDVGGTLVFKSTLSVKVRMQDGRLILVGEALRDWFAKQTGLKEYFDIQVGKTAILIQKKQDCNFTMPFKKNTGPQPPTGDNYYYVNETP